MGEVKANSPEFLSDPRKVEFLDFLAAPKTLRGMTQQEFAQKIQVSAQTLSEWKKLDGFMEELLRKIRNNAKDDAADIVGALADKAKKGDPSAIKLWLQFAVGWSEKLSHQIQEKQQITYVIKRAAS